jgi:peroxiredoxin
MQIIGGAIAAAVVAIVIVVAVGRSVAGSQKATGPPIVTPGSYQPKSQLLQTGTKAPGFTLTDVHGKSYSLAAQRGHPVLLEFFAVWCPHCQAEAHIIQNLATQYAPKGVRVWAILSNPYGRNYDNSFGLDTSVVSANDLKWFASTFHEHVPQLVDPAFRVPNVYGAHAYPTIYVINKGGVITHASSGEIPQGDLASALNSALHSS